jgi:hypothetical protein
LDGGFEGSWWKRRKMKLGEILKITRRKFAKKLGKSQRKSSRRFEKKMRKTFRKRKQIEVNLLK